MSIFFDRIQVQDIDFTDAHGAIMFNTYSKKGPMCRVDLDIKGKNIVSEC